MSLQASYRGKSISSIDALASTLGCNPIRLRFIAGDISSHYSTFSTKKKNGGERIICAPNQELKTIQRRINSRIFSSCYFPDYLQGSVKDDKNPRDFVSNAKKHCEGKTVVLADIKDFYPSITTGNVVKIFKYLFRLPEEVANILADLTTLKGNVPQGAPTSSYLANLVFYDCEHKLVNTFQRAGYVYTRLIDDITVSSPQLLRKKKTDWIVSKISSLLTSKGFIIHPEKLKIAITRTPGQQVYVTGLWIDDGHPRLARQAVNSIRAGVNNCSKLYEAGHKTAPDYHVLHSEISGKVALMTRLGHRKAAIYRQSLQKCLPEYSEKHSKKIKTLCYRFIKRKGHGADSAAYHHRYFKLMHYLGILGRSEPIKTRIYRAELKRFPPEPYKE